MKTSTIKVDDMLSVLSVEEVEKRISEVPGVESVTVNFAAENATVRYDEARLEATDIKSAVRRKSYESDAPRQSTVKTVKDEAEAPATPPAVKPPEEKEKTETTPPAKAENTNVPPPATAAVKPGEEKVEAPATPLAVNPLEEKDKAETKSSALGEKKEDAGHIMDEMSKEKE